MFDGSGTSYTVPNGDIKVSCVVLYHRNALGNNYTHYCHSDRCRNVFKSALSQKLIRYLIER